LNLIKLLNCRYDLKVSTNFFFKSSSAFSFYILYHRYIFKSKMSSSNNNNISASSSSSTFVAPTTTAPATTAPATTAPATTAPAAAIQINNNNDGSAGSNEWTESQVRVLINQRKYRNREYHLIIGRSRRNFWNSVSRRINRSEGTNFSGEQCKRKFQNLVSTYYVSKLI
jgi:Myb/SANT-like DNA-binding domain